MEAASEVGFRMSMMKLCRSLELRCPHRICASSISRGWANAGYLLNHLEEDAKKNLEPNRAFVVPLIEKTANIDGSTDVDAKDDGFPKFLGSY